MKQKKVLIAVVLVLIAVVIAGVVLKKNGLLAGLFSSADEMQVDDLGRIPTPIWAHDGLPFRLDLYVKRGSVYSSYINRYVNEWEQSGVVDFNVILLDECAPQNFVKGAVSICDFKGAPSEFRGGGYRGDSNLDSVSVMLNTNNGEYDVEEFRNALACFAIGYAAYPGLWDNNQLISNVNFDTCMEAPFINPGFNIHPNFQSLQHHNSDDFEILRSVYNILPIE